MKGKVVRKRYQQGLASDALGIMQA